MTMADFKELFTAEVLAELFPETRTNDFFEALFGDTEEGAYDISLHFAGQTQEMLNFEFRLNQRPGRCLACNLTYGLPEVFTRHPIINVKGLVKKIEEKLDGLQMDRRRLRPHARPQPRPRGSCQRGLH